MGIVAVALFAFGTSAQSLFSTDGVVSLAPDGTGDTIITFTNFNASQTLVLNQALSVRILLVGGGGGGGAECGGGGGGGGMIDTNDVELAVGTYTITVGRRGEGGNTAENNGVKKGGNGGNTSLAFGGVVLLEAVGGGGGGTWNGQPGLDGGSGGGGGSNTGAGGAGTDGQGYAGGNSCGGGGGAGGQGGNGKGGKNSQSYGVGAKNGAGGIGRISDITGVEVYYGGGGGGGGYQDNPGPGGLGGGGNGMRDGNEATRKARSQEEFDAEAGVDGLGGGGGGGNNTDTYYGRPGGSGVMIVRIAASAASSSVPEIAFAGQTATNRHSVTLLARLDSAGDGHEGETVSLSIEYAKSLDALVSGDSVTNLLSSSFSGTGAFEIAGLESDTTYRGRLVAVNGSGDRGLSRPFAFSAMAIHGPRLVAADGSTGKPGLWQCMVSGTGTSSFNTEIDGGTEGAVVMPGTVMAAVTSRQNTDSYWKGDGMSYTDASGSNWTFRSGISYIYSGYALLRAGVTYRFFERMMDNCRLKIDGVDIINDTGVSYATTTYGSYSCLTDGWHRVQIWLGGSDSGAGNFDKWAFSFGYNTNGLQTVSGSPGKDWSMFLDPGDGSFLYADLPARKIEAMGYTINMANDIATFEVALDASTPAIGDTKLYVAYGLDDGGTMSNFWTHIEQVGALPFGRDAQNVSVTVSDLSELRYATFFAVGEDGSVGWSEVVDIGEIDTSIPVLSTIAITHDGDTATATFSIFGLGAGNVTSTLYVAQSDDFDGAAAIPLAEATTIGQHSATFAIAPGVANYAKVVVTDANGGSATALSGAFTPLTGSIFDVNKRRTTVTHRTATISGAFVYLGAGTTTVTLFTGPSSGSLTQDGDSVTLSHPDFSFTRTYNETPTARHYYKIVAINTAPGGTCWTNESSIGEFRTLDQAAYRWKASVADGYWDDASSWDAVTYTDYCTGFPRQGHPDGGDILFTNGLAATIRVAGAQVGSRMKLGGTDMDVLFLGEGTGASLTLDMQGKDLSLSRSTLTFSNLNVIEQDNFDGSLGISSDTNVVVRFTDGTRLSRSGGSMMSGDFSFKPSDSSIVIDGGASVATEGLKLEGRGARLVVDGGTLSVGNNGVLFNASSADSQVSFVIGGEGGRLVCSRGVFSNISGKAVNNDVSLAFLLPASGWSDAPLYSSYESGTFANFTGTGNTGKVVVSLDSGSVALRATRGLSTQAIAWCGGIATNNISFAESKRATWAWTYGWPSTLAAPENEGDLPTGLRLDFASGGATVVILK